MATNYPGSKQTFTDPAGTNTLDSPDHAGLHTDMNDTMEAVQDTVGTTAGTNVLLDFAAGDFPIRQDASQVLQEAVTGGTLNTVTLGTPIMGAWTTSGTTVASVPARALAPTVVTLTDAVGTITPNAPSAQVFHLILGTSVGNRTLAAPLNATEGQAISFRVKQNAGDTGTLIFNAIYRMSSDLGTPTLGTASTYNYYGFRYNTIDTKWDFQGESKNII